MRRPRPIKRIKVSWRIFKIWRGWRKKAKDEIWPYEYIGDSMPAYGLKKGMVLRRVMGQKGAPGGQRYFGKDGVTRVIHHTQVRER